MRYRKVKKWRELTRGVKAKWRKTNGRKQGLGISVVSVFEPVVYVLYCINFSHVLFARVRVSLVGIVTRLWARWSGVWIPVEAMYFLFPKCQDQLYGPPSYLIVWSRRSFRRRAVDHSPPSSGAVNNSWSCASTVHICLQWRGQREICLLIITCTIICATLTFLLGIWRRAVGCLILGIVKCRRRILTNQYFKIAK